MKVTFQKSVTRMKMIKSLKVSSTMSYPTYVLNMYQDFPLFLSDPVFLIQKVRVKILLLVSITNLTSFIVLTQ